MSKVLLFSFRWSDGSCAKGKNRIRNKEQEAKMKSFHQTTRKKVSAVKKNLVWLFLFHLLYFDSLFSRLPPVPIESLRPSSSSVFFCCCPCIQGGGSPKSLAVKQAAKRVDCWEKELAKVQTGKRTRVSGPCCVCCRTGASNDSNNNKEIKGNVVVVVVERR